MPALGHHGRHLILLRRREIREIGMPLCEQHPGVTSFREISDFMNIAAGVNRFDVAQLRRFVPDGNRRPVIVRDVRELLARPVNQEVETEALVRVTDDRRLGPSVGAHRRNRHDPVLVENGDCRLFHRSLSAFSRIYGDRRGSPARTYAITDQMSFFDRVRFHAGMPDSNARPPSAMVQYMYGSDRFLGVCANHSRSAGAGTCAKASGPVPWPVHP